MGTLSVRNGLVLVPGEPDVRPLDVRIDGTSIAELVAPEAAVTNGEHVVDATDAWVLPGIVDVHGDAFERAIMPRPGVTVSVTEALAHNDAQLLAAGITTAFLSVTDSWEPGLRGRAMLREIIATCAAEQGLVDRRIHVRHERCNTSEFDELLQWVTSGSIHMISFNDHTPGAISPLGSGVSPTQIGRTGCTEADLLDLQQQAIDRRPLGLEHDDALAVACRAAACPTASHDAATNEDLDRDVRLGVNIAEFPTSIALAHQFQEQNIDVLLGAPNLVRGGSHLGNLSVRESIAAGAGTLLCSDYHYPSLLHAPFLLTELGLANLLDAWSMVSANPAAAAGLHDRGHISIGQRADLIIVEPPTSSRGPRVRTVICNGHIVSTTSAA